MAKKKKSGQKKRFVLDTNVILHDADCVKRFEENDIYIPITVLEELDRFKKGSDQVNFNARQFLRTIDQLIQAQGFQEGLSLGEGAGRLFFLPCQDMCGSLLERTPDNIIIGVFERLANDGSNMDTILVSKDINMRVKAYSAGLQAEDYLHDKVTNETLFADSQPSVYVPSELIDRFYQVEGGLSTLEVEEFLKPKPNLCLELRSERNSALARINSVGDTIRRVPKGMAMGIGSRNREQSFAFDVLMDPSIRLVALTGKAGTGKTLLALAAALSLMERKEEFEQILLSRPIVALSNKDLGFLPGDEKEKVRPYMQPLFDNLNTIKRAQREVDASKARLIDEWEQGDKLVIEALAYIRGRSLTNSFCIIDEAQNLTPHEIKTIITRSGEGTKMVFTGDLQQIDSPYLDSTSNGLAYMIGRMGGEPLFAHVNLVKGERSELSDVASRLL